MKPFIALTLAVALTGCGGSSDGGGGGPDSPISIAWIGGSWTSTDASHGSCGGSPTSAVLRISMNADRSAINGLSFTAVNAVIGRTNGQDVCGDYGPLWIGNGTINQYTGVLQMWPLNVVRDGAAASLTLVFTPNAAKTEADVAITCTGACQGMPSTMHFVKTAS